MNVKRKKKGLELVSLGIDDLLQSAHSRFFRSSVKHFPGLFAEQTWTHVNKTIDLYGPVSHKEILLHMGLGGRGAATWLDRELAVRRAGRAASLGEDDDAGVMSERGECWPCCLTHALLSIFPLRAAWHQMHPPHQSNSQAGHRWIPRPPLPKLWSTEGLCGMKYYKNKKWA